MMTTMQHVHALVGSSDATLVTPSVSFTQVDLPTIAQHMLALMLRSVTSDGFVLNDPNTDEPSKPGCVIAAPSYPLRTPCAPGPARTSRADR